MKINIKINKKLIIVLTVVLVLIPLTVHAQSPDSNVITETLSKLQGVVRLFLQLAQQILWPILIMIGGLLGNDLLFSSGMEERLLSIWVQIRNFVNIGFVIILIGIALYNVTGIVTREDLMLKTILPKFVIALVLVNFSFIGMKLVLDTTNVLTNAVFAMPAGIEDSFKTMETFDFSDEELQELNNILGSKNNMGDEEAADLSSNMTGEKQEKLQQICRNIYGDTKSFIKMATEKEIKHTFCNISTGSEKYVFTKKGFEYFSKYHQRNSAMIIAIQLMNVIQLDQVYQFADLGDLSSLVFNTIFSAVLYVLYAAAYIALFAILVVRLVVLWIVIALSPLIVLTLVFKGAQGGMGQFKEKIINYILAPIYIGIPLTIGYIMLSAYKNFDGSSDTSGATDLMQLTSTIDMKTSGISNLQEMIIAFAAVAVIWVGVFSVAAQKFAVGQWIAGGLKRMGRAAGQIVKYAPIIPVGRGPKGEKQKMALASLSPIRGMEEIASKFRQNVEGQGKWKEAKTAKDFLKGVRLSDTSPMHQREYAKLLRERRELRKEMLSKPQLYKALGAGSAAEALKKLEKGEAKPAEIKEWFQRAARVQGGVKIGSEATPSQFVGGATPPAGSQRPQDGGRSQLSMDTDLSAGEREGTIDAVPELVTDKNEIEKVTDANKRLDMVRRTRSKEAYKKLQAANEPTAMINTIKSTAGNYDESNNATVKALGNALKDYQNTIKADDSIDDDQAKAFTEAVLKKSVGNKYPIVKRKLEENDEFKDILPS